MKVFEISEIDKKLHEIYERVCDIGVELSNLESNIESAIEYIEDRLDAINGDLATLEEWVEELYGQPSRASNKVEVEKKLRYLLENWIEDLETIENRILGIGEEKNE